MSDVINLEHERTRHDPQWFALPTSLRILDMVKECSGRTAVAMVIAAPGLGKSYALRRACVEAPSTVMVTLNRATGSIAEGLLVIYEALAEHPLYHSCCRDEPPRAAQRVGTLMRLVMRALIRSMEARDEVPVLAIDEAQFASRKLLDCLRSLYDDGLCSLVICGNDEFSVEGLDPLLSRSSMEIYAPVPFDEDVFAYLDARGIAHPKARKLLAAMISVRGIRGAEELIRRAGGTSGKSAPSYAALEAAVDSIKFLPKRS